MRTPRPTLRYLARRDVEAAMPEPEERLRLAELTLRALATGGGGDAPRADTSESADGPDRTAVPRAELPAKIGVHPRPADSFGHAMPAFLRGAAADGSEDRLGVKWVTGVPGNVATGLPAIHALVVLNDPATGVSRAVLDGGPITAQRTAAVSGVAIRLLARPSSAPRAALVGAGVQGHSHAAILGHLLPGLVLSVLDVDAERARRLATEAGELPGIGQARAVERLEDAVDGADIVVTCAAFGPRHGLLPAGLVGDRTLVVAVDYDTYASAELAARVASFLTDEIAQFIQTRADGVFFQGFRDPDGTLGDALLSAAVAGRSASPRGPGLVAHLGVGLADVVFGSAILEEAERRGLGVELPR